MNESARRLQRRDNTVSRNMFLNIFFVHHNSIAAAEHGSDFRKSGERSVTFLSVEWTPSRPKRSAYNATQDHDRLSYAYRSHQRTDRRSVCAWRWHRAWGRLWG